MRECGLKCGQRSASAGRSKSLPVRECGLKFIYKGFTYASLAVTPCAGVWIEIKNKQEKGDIKKSLPVRECGLKLQGDA